MQTTTRPITRPTTHRRSVRVLGALSVAAGALPIALTAPAAAAPCPDVEILFARGTTEPPGVGVVGQAFVDSLRSQLGARSVGVYAVDYPATDDFVNSTTAGVGDASAHLQATAANCPATKMVLGDYSQGAAVMDLATGAVPARYPRSARSMQARPSTCACPTIRSAPKVGGTWAPTSPTSRRGW
jgi:Cutinase